jgi:tetratricopeptide (TPR) repeat protein
MKYMMRFPLGCLLTATLLTGCQSLPDYQVFPKADNSGRFKPKAVPPTSPGTPVYTESSAKPAMSGQTPSPAMTPGTPLILKPASVPPQPARRLADGRDMPAVQGLLASADAYLQQNNLEEAANSLERAQRLAPQSATVYLRLSETRLRQGRLVEAEQLARKGVGFAQTASLQAALWREVATAAERQGKADVARQARQKAEQLEAGGDRS